MISIIIPCLNEAGIMVPALAALQPLRRTGGHELIVVDGGSRDDSAALAAPLADQVLITRPGRARQMNRGAAVARGQVLWFLHLDTEVFAQAPEAIVDGLRRSQRGWGRFDVRLSGSRFLFRVVALMMNLRSRVTGIATGDQGIFVERGLFFRQGGYPEMPLMEDIALSRRLKRCSRPHCIRRPLVTSSRRWEQGGAWRTILLMWRLRLAYALGADPARLASRYRERR